MKRSHISSLQQSLRKHSTTNRTNISAQKTKKAIFQQNKQNLHPNIARQRSLKKCAKLKAQLKYKCNKKALKSKNFVQASMQNDQESFLSPFKPNFKMDQRDQLTNKLINQSLKLEKMLEQKKQKQTKTCIQYYNWIRQQINLQEKAILTEINDCFCLATKQIEVFRQKLDNLTGSQKEIYTYTIQIPLISVVIDEQTRQSLKTQLSKLSLLQINHEIKDNFEESTFRDIEFLRQDRKQIKASANKTRFCQRQKNTGYSDYENIGDNIFESCELSPSFKHV